MTNVRISPMDSQRYDFSTRRKPSCFEIVTNATAEHHLTLSPVEVSLQSPKSMGQPWEYCSLTTPSGRTSLSDSTSESGSIIEPSSTSLVESRTSTLSGHPLSTKNESAADVRPYLRKSKSSVGRILCGLDCRRSTTCMFGDDLEYIPAQHEGKKSPSSGRLLPGVENRRVGTPISLKPEKEIHFTDIYDHEDGYTTTRTIIRSLARSRSTPQGIVHRGVFRMRSLDCIRSMTAFEDELDAIWQAQALGKDGHGQHMRLRVDEECTVVTEEKWRSAVQSMLYQNTPLIRSVVSRVEVD